MTPEQFAYWLQGFKEIANVPPTAEQWQMIKDHLDTVFFKVTPENSVYQIWDSQPKIGNQLQTC